MSVDSKTKSYQIYWRIALLYISYNNSQSSDLYGPRPISIMMIKAFGLIVDCLIGWGWSLLFFLSIWLSLVWLIPEPIHFTHELHTWVIGMAIETRYCSHRFDFYRSNLSSWQITSLINCIFGYTIHQDPNPIMTAGLSSYKSRFIYHFKIAALSRGIVLR